MKKVFILISILALIILLITGFTKIFSNVKIDTPPPSDDTLKTKPQKIIIKLPIDTFYTDFARIISGKNVLKNFNETCNKDFWKDYSKKCDEVWKILDNKLLNPISKWLNDNNISGSGDTANLFYPFAGGDFVYANAFYPQTKKMVLIGLEPAGNIFDFAQLKDETRKDYLNALLHSMDVSNRIGFFKTINMRVELTKKYLNGTVHTLLFYMTRTNHLIRNIELFKLDTLGNPVLVNWTNKDNSSYYGVKIDYCDSSRTNAKTIYYMSYNIVDENLKKHTELFKFVSQFGTCNVLLKSASYLLHQANFSLMCNYILSHSEKILQDDTGVPYKKLIGDNWSINLFGKYTRTIPLFAGRFQSDLAKAFKTDSIHKLPFLMGYNVQHNESNMIWAKKKTVK